MFPEGDRPFVVAGPCSAESRQQVLEAASALRDAGVGVFRAGIWKPRTHPGGFEGVGHDGLAWLADAHRQTGMKICTEVGSADHVRACLDAGVDMLWIGARTTANPFQVQEICDALRGSNLPVLVKNPVSPDLDLWIGAVERLMDAGIGKIGVVLRGFTTLDKTPYRNAPVWEMSTRIRTRLKDVPLFVDPSHMAGAVTYIKELSQRALDLGACGLMIEVHPNPEKALSDARQQLSPSQFAALKASLRVRTNTSSDGEYLRSMEELRSSIDDIDSRLLSLLEERMRVSRSIGALKKEHGISILQTGRWESVMEALRKDAESIGLDKKMVEEIFSVIHDYSVKAQE
ncbi:MAG: chorismate mutase [Bacteroidales bacterium]|nr:chorismate mutase [Bacteroidales bacterium]